MKVGAIISAAGTSMQTGVYRQLNKIGNITIPERIIKTLLYSGVDEIVIITGYKHKELERNLKYPNVVFINDEEYENSDMFTSIKLGLNNLSVDCDKILICPLGTPYFTVSTVKEILKTQGLIVNPVYEGKKGHPIIIDSLLIHKITEYSGDGGLREAYSKLGVVPIEVEVKDRGIISIESVDEYNALEIKEDVVPIIKLNLEKWGVSFGEDAYYLLRNIKITGNVSKACKRCGISYSKGWSIIESAQEAMGVTLVNRTVGGKGGGKAILTDEAVEIMDKFFELEKDISEYARGAFGKRF